jgi:hypothetical protein
MIHINTYEQLKHEAKKSGVLISEICNHVNYTHAGLKRAFENDRASLTLKNDIAKYIQHIADTNYLNNPKLGKLDTFNDLQEFAVKNNVDINEIAKHFNYDSIEAIKENYNKNTWSPVTKIKFYEFVQENSILVNENNPKYNVKNNDLENQIKVLNEKIELYKKMLEYQEKVINVYERNKQD